MAEAKVTREKSGVKAARRVRRQPLYTQVQHEIADAITSGEWLPGTLIPGETELADEHRVSVGTVRRALGELVNNGYLERRPRHGTFVSNKRPHHDLRMFYEFFRLHTEDDRLVKSAAQDVSIQTRIATATEASDLALPAGQNKIASIERLRCVDKVPVMYDQVLIPLYLMPGFPLDSPLPDLFFQYYEVEFGLRIVTVRERLAAIAANERDAEVLGVSVGHPLLEIETTARDRTNRIVEIRTCKAETEGYRYVNEVR